MTTPLTILVAVAAWLLVVLVWQLTVVPWLTKGPSGDPVTGFLWQVVRTYSRLVHHTTFTGTGLVPPTNCPGGLVVVSNHTGPIDPMLVQAACRFEIRWMMAADMMAPQLNWLWRRLKIIPVARDGRDSTSAREAIRHVRGGGVVGIFPEGGIVRPPGEIRPFHSGAGLIISRTAAPVLLVWVCDTSGQTEIGPALVTSSRARVTFVERIEFAAKSDPTAVTEQLRQRLAEASGWPINDEPLIPPAANADSFAA
jgi:1-acyl-sn-glycerol-3-phosphate acyltransferase